MSENLEKIIETFGWELYLGIETASEAEGLVIAKRFADELLANQKAAIEKAVEGLGRVDTGIKTHHLIVESTNGGLLFRDEVFKAISEATE